LFWKVAFQLGIQGHTFKNQLMNNLEYTGRKWGTAKLSARAEGMMPDPMMYERLKNHWMRLVTTNNDFNNISYGILALGGSPNSPLPNERKQVSIIGNTARRIQRDFVLGGSDNLLIEGNSIYDYSIIYSAEPYNSRAFYITTNGFGGSFGSASRNFTNVTIKNNLMWNTTNADLRSYFASIGGVNNFTVVDNTHNAYATRFNTAGVILDGLALGGHDPASPPETYGGTRQIFGDSLAFIGIQNTNAQALYSGTNINRMIRVNIGGTNFYLPAYISP